MEKMAKKEQKILSQLGLGLFLLSASIINGQGNVTTALLDSQHNSLDICRSTVYILQNNLPKKSSKKISKKLSKQLKKVKKGLKVKKRYYNTDCRFVDCVIEDVGKTKATHAFVLDNSVIPLGADRSIVMRELLYDFNSDKIRPSAQLELLNLLRLLEENPRISLELSSHTDSRGVDAYNLDLSQRRANSVMNWLTNNGVDADRLRAVGYGETRPATITSQQEGLYPFMKEGDMLTLDYINVLDNAEKQNIAHGLNRRTEVSISSTVARKMVGGTLDLMLLDLESGVLVSEISADFIGSQKNLYSKIENMSWELVANFGLEKCKGGLGVFLVPIIIVGGGAGYYAYMEMMDEDESIGAPPTLPEDCCGR
tara:strand:+ start:1841 stop:2947 length:1107 start_codon:yes stop_codon:yes gene_type:complete